MIAFPRKKSNLTDTLLNQHDVVCEIRRISGVDYVTVHSRKDWKNPQKTIGEWGASE